MACEQVVGGYESVGNYMDQSSTIIATEVASTSVLDSLKRHRGISISFLELLERRKKLAVHQIESTSKKIAANTAKVNQNRGVPGLESEVERLDDVIKSVNILPLPCKHY
jgi:replicative DNA helicase